MSTKKDYGDLKCFVCDGEEVRQVQYKVLARNAEEARQKIEAGQCLVESKSETARELGTVKAV